MEEQAPAAPSIGVENIGFPGSVQPQKKKGGKKWIVIVLVFLILIGGITFFVLKSSNSGEGSDSLNPSASTSPVTPTPTPTPTPAPVDKTQIRISVLNGTGIAGEAASLQDQLRVLGYTSVTTGNADTDTATATQVTFSSTLAQSVFDEVLAKLKGIYQTVNSTTSRSLTSSDIQIIIGLKKGATAKPQATDTPSPTPTVTP